LGEAMETKTTTAKVWIVNEAGHPYEKAREVVGECVFDYLTVGNVNPLRVDRMLFHLAKGIAKYSRKDDYVLISGTPMLNAGAILLWVLFHKSARVLQWNAKKRNYELTTIELDHILNMLERAIDGS
jgi:hypothetical protein